MQVSDFYCDPSPRLNSQTPPTSSQSPSHGGSHIWWGMGYGQTLWRSFKSREIHVYDNVWDLRLNHGSCSKQLMLLLGNLARNPSTSPDHHGARRRRCGSSVAAYVILTRAPGIVSPGPKLTLTVAPVADIFTIHYGHHRKNR